MPLEIFLVDAGSGVVDLERLVHDIGAHATLLGNAQQPVDADLVDLRDGKHGVGARQAHIFRR